MGDQKQCITCGLFKDFSEFSKNIRTIDGRRNECTECRNIKRKVIRAADYDALFVSQGGKCAICGVDSVSYGRRFSIDHDHEDNAVRGLLCHHCNTIIGMADEEVQILQAAIGYLNLHKTKII